MPSRMEEWRKGPDPFELGKIVGSMHTLAPEFKGKTRHELRMRAEGAFNIYGKDLGWREIDLARFLNGYKETNAAHIRDESPK